ncbi:zinc finger MYM-type protein 1-like [Camponotus floridanus]|uniref:zinc finger MYM-type protein 1-like n=1 Tax=Camponotus floridanus TaxID=104421 RepID=UPI000DC6B1BA|nr:zinc finger MYM-type protein 1-like [Camponotus floridanus]
MNTWNEARLARISAANCSNISHMSEKLYIEEKQKWRNILERVIAIIQYLAEHNMALRGSSDLLNTPNNGNFLGLVELMARIKKCCYLFKQNIQNELISLMGNKIRNTVIGRIKAVKYFSVLLDCTPDTSHQEQLSCIIRYVHIHNGEVQICESFTGFLVVKDTSGLGLATTLKQHLNDCGLDFTNCRGQGYDNGANMKGYKAGVQAQLLRENPKAFFTPCGCHNLNLVLADIASVSPKAVTFFGVIQRFYTFLSASNYRYDITKKYLKLTPKTLSDTRWECRVESVKAVRFQIKEFVQIFEEILTEPKDPKAASEATSLLKEIQSFPFILSTVIWYELLVKVNRVSKMLQQRDVQMDVAISLLDNLLKELLTFREDGYQECVKTTKIIAEQNNVIPHFPQKRVARSKRPFDYESVDDPIRNEEEQFRIEYFLLVTDQAIASFKERFKLYEDLRNNFGFLYDFRKIKTISKKDLMKNCMDFHNILQDGQNSDVDGVDLLEEFRDKKHSYKVRIKTLND